jgi:hypothetical protein
MLSWWRKPGFAAAFALSFLCFFAFNKQAFANYYFLIIAALACAIPSPPYAGERDRVRGSCALRQKARPSPQPSPPRTGERG